MLLKITSFDYQLCAPGPLDRQHTPFVEKVLKAPCVIIFGVFNEVRVCLHVHLVYSYLYVEYSGCVLSLAASINAALNVRFNKKAQHVSGIILLRAKSIYGYNSDSTFAKIFLIDPDMKLPLAQLLGSGAVLGKVMQPYEAHIPYLLQFMADFKISETINIKWALSRGKNSDFETSPYLKSSFCELELDTCAPFIEVDNSTEWCNTPSLQKLWIQESERRIRFGLPELQKPMICSQKPLDLSKTSLWPKKNRLKQLKMLEPMDFEDSITKTDINLVFDENLSQFVHPEEISEDEGILSQEVEDDVFWDIVPQLDGPSDFLTEEKFYQMFDNKFKYNVPHPSTEEATKGVFLHHQVPFTNQKKESNSIVQYYDPEELNDFHSKLSKIMNLPYEEKEENCEKSFTWLYAKPLPNIEEAVKFSPEKQTQSFKATQEEKNNFKTFGIEVYVDSDNPDPQQHEIKAVFYFIAIDSIQKKGILWKNHCKISGFMQQTEFFDTEIELVNALVKIVLREDPDALFGYETNYMSWGYLDSRFPWFADKVSRMMRPRPRSKNEYFARKTSSFESSGRIILNLWRLMRQEIADTNYTLENMCLKILKARTPHFDQKTLISFDESRICEYFTIRNHISWKIISECGIISRTYEFALMYGCDFVSILSRGSQFLVESVLLRLTKQENLLLPSLSRKQVSQQREPSCFPLVMEPQSGFYVDPVIVVDFQSLYPSIMMAYNYCYSTMLKNKEINHIISPNGVLFAEKNVRESTLSKLLKDLIETRIMIRESNKLRESKSLNQRQLGLKLIANVIYGYTAATHTGRMPCVDISDSIVQTGRRTLEKAIEAINSSSKWNARVVYADTDSAFIVVPGRSREEAFEIGREIAEHVTSLNPNPVRLKFEKVYHPCVLISKKRYMGLKYEGKTYEFEAKGTEVIRRDGCKILQTMLKQSTKILFETKNIDLVREYVQFEFSKIKCGSVNLYDFIVAKEVRSSYRVAPIGARLRQVNTQYRERVPYVVVLSEEKTIKGVDPVEFYTGGYRLNSRYYIENLIIPALNRVFKLIGVDVSKWTDTVSIDVEKPITELCFECSMDYKQCTNIQCRVFHNRNLF